jgi:hypothetical protein
MRILCLLAGLSLLLTTSCSSSEDASSSGMGGAGTGGEGSTGGAGGDVPAPCTTNEGPLPWALDLPGAEPNGVFDLDFAHDPDSGTLWAVYSGVTGPAGSGQVSTHLAFSDDAGATWCGGWTLNPSTLVPADELPEAVSGDEGHWNHETASLVHDPGAPASDRWRVVWHRYLVVDDGVPGTDDRLFAYGWYGQRRAATAKELLSAPEEKLFSGLAYSVDGAIEAYNDAQPGGAPLHRWNQDLELADCVAFAEPGLLAEGGSLYLATMCIRAETDLPIVLVSLAHASEMWSYRGTLLESSDGVVISPSTTGFNAADLFTFGDRHRLVITPTAGDGYEGCVIFEVDLLTGTLLDADGNGPDVLFTLPPTTDADVFHRGACAYDEAGTTGLVVSDAYLTGVTFRLNATGITL